MAAVISTEVREARIVCLLENGRAGAWPEICAAFGLDPLLMSASHEALRAALRSLKNAGVIDYKAPPPDAWSYPGVVGSITVTNAWREIQSLLGIDLNQITDCDPKTAMTVKPFWGKAVEETPQLDVFVLTPACHGRPSICQQRIADVVSRLSLSIGCTDDVRFPRYHRGAVWSAILKSRVVIADCTGRDASVFYEIGLADAIGKRIILITQNREDLPLGREHANSICYSPDDWPDFEQQLAEHVWSSLGS